MSVSIFDDVYLIRTIRRHIVDRSAAVVAFSALSGPMPHVKVDLPRNPQGRRGCSTHILMVGRPTGWGIVFNMSDRGLQLATTEEYEPMSLLWLALNDGDSDRGFLKVRVDHAEYRPGVGWVLDCCFGKPGN